MIIFISPLAPFVASIVFWSSCYNRKTDFNLEPNHHNQVSLVQICETLSIIQFLFLRKVLNYVQIILKAGSVISSASLNHYLNNSTTTTTATTTRHLKHHREANKPWIFVDNYLSLPSLSINTHTLTHTHTHTLSHTNTLSISQTHTLTQPLTHCVSHTHTLTLTHTFSLSHKHTLSLTNTHTYSTSHTLTSHTLCLTHTHLHSHTLSLSLSLTHTQTHRLILSLPISLTFPLLHSLVTHSFPPSLHLFLLSNSLPLFIFVLPHLLCLSPPSHNVFASSVCHFKYYFLTLSLSLALTHTVSKTLNKFKKIAAVLGSIL